MTMEEEVLEPVEGAEAETEVEPTEEEIAAVADSEEAEETVA